jgi:predicted nucleic acid-binding protein
MSLFYKQLNADDLARLSFAELRKHATKAISNTTELSDFYYAEMVMQHCIARLTYDPRPKRHNGNQNQNQGDGNQQGQHNGNRQNRR